MPSQAQSRQTSEAGSERRRSKPRQAASGEAKLGIRQADGSVRIVAGQLVDLSDFGFGIETEIPLAAGDRVTVASRFFQAGERLIQRAAQVMHCRLRDTGTYRSGLAFEQTSETKQQPRPPTLEEGFTDYYEVLQVSPNADLDTIQRVYRLLAQRYHPDNAESGNEEAFRLVLNAFRVLIDPEQRAGYDAKHKSQRSLRWRIFTQTSEAMGVDEEKRTRVGILSALYAMRRTQPTKGGMLVRELESLLACPSEHLEFSFWYLQGKGLVERTDGGRYTITPAGVDLLEESDEAIIRPPLRLIEDGQAG